MFTQLPFMNHGPMKVIRLQLLKTAFILLCLIFLAVKQHEFLFHAISAHPELNLLIIGVFTFGLVIAVRSIFILGNDDRALRCLKETYVDFDTNHKTHDEGDLKRLMRVSTPSVLFSFPRIIGQIFDIIMEEMMLTRTFHVSLAQRNAMMGMVQESINREKSLVQYMTGVMILLGLIGTFIGLMEMVASVGGIVGGLARAGSGSDEAIKNVIKDLETPLTGMATGFSASLFGLLGSLILGLVARFSQTATLAIKRDLEHWLTRIGEIEAPYQVASSHGNGSHSSVTGLAASLVGSFRTLQGLIVRSAEMMRKLAERQDTQTEAMTRLIDSIDALSVRHEQALWQLRRVDSIGDSIEAMRSETILNEKILGNRLTAEFGRLSDIVGQADARNANRYSDLIEYHRVTERLARSLELQTVRGFEELNLKAASLMTEHSEIKRQIGESHDQIGQHLRDQTRPIDMEFLSNRLGAAVDERLASGFGAVADTLDKSLSTLAESLKHFGDAQTQTMKRLDDVASHPLADEMRQLSRSIETGLAAGFSDLSRVLDVLISSQVMSADKEEASVTDNDHSLFRADDPPSSVRQTPQDYAAVLEAFRMPRDNQGDAQN